MCRAGRWDGMRGGNGGISYYPSRARQTELRKWNKHGNTQKEHTSKLLSQNLDSIDSTFSHRNLFVELAFVFGLFRGRF